jgi:hypothetical protein
MIGYPGKTAGTKKNGIVFTHLLQTAIRHHLAGFAVMLTTPRKFVPLKTYVKFTADGFQYPNALGDNFVTDAIAGNSGYFIGLHAISSNN